jgi:sugar lactone lactonase YvrE
LKHAAPFILAASLLASTALAGREPPLGTAAVLATVPAPGFPGPMGFPEGLAVNGDRVFVGASATFGTTGSVASQVYAFDRRTGALLRTYAIEGQNLAAEHAIVGMGFDRNGLLYVTDTQQGLVRLDPESGAQEVYASIPDLKPCSVAPAPCSPTAIDRPPLPNDLAFDEDGNAYITDTFQATLWRVPPGGGEAQIWFQDPILDGFFGPNGIRISPDNSKLYFNITAGGATFGTPGFVFRLPLVDHPTSADLATVHTYPFEGADGMAFGRSGKLYVALAVANQISVLGPDGTEEARYAGPASARPSPIPFDAPASVGFDDESESLLVTNHALFTGIPSHFVVFKAFVDDKGHPLIRPELQ